MSDRPNRKPPAPKLLTEPFWEKQRGESQTAFNYFVTFRDMEGKRTNEKVSVAVHRHINTVHRIARRWRWKERVHAYDLYQDAERRHRLEAERQKADDNNLVLIKTAKTRVAEAIRALAPEEFRVKPETLLQNLKLLIDMERQNLGQVTSRIEIDTPEMISERRLRDAIQDVMEAMKLNQDVSFEERARWAADDYQVPLDRVIAGYNQMTVDSTSTANN